MGKWFKKTEIQNSKIPQTKKITDVQNISFHIFTVNSRSLERLINI